MAGFSDKSQLPGKNFRFLKTICKNRFEIMGQFGFEAMELNCDTDMEEGQFKRIIWLCTLQRIPKVVVSFIQFIWMTDHTLQFVIQMSDLAGGRGPTEEFPWMIHDIPLYIHMMFPWYSLYFTIFHYISLYSNDIPMKKSHEQIPCRPS